MRRGSEEGGQATVEWVGLVLGVALALGALAAGGREAAKGQSADGLGQAVAERITCAARDLCGAAGRGALRPLRGAPNGALGGAPRGRRGLRPSAPREAPRRGAPTRGASSVSGVAKRTWLVCLAYRRWRYEYDHFHSPSESMPVRDTLKIVNGCVNPLSFFFG